MVINGFRVRVRVPVSIQWRGKSLAVNNYCN